jgi:hypothetical protein
VNDKDKLIAIKRITERDNPCCTCCQSDQSYAEAMEDIENIILNGDNECPDTIDQSPKEKESATARVYETSPETEEALTALKRKLAGETSTENTTTDDARNPKG